MRVVLNAVSLETVAEVVALRKELLICEEEITRDPLAVSVQARVKESERIL